MTAHAGDTPDNPESLPKSQWRRLLQRRRASLDTAVRRRCAQRCSEHLMRALRRRRARSVAVYLACGAELSTSALIAQLHGAGLRVFVPRLRGNAMRLLRLRKGAPLRRNRFGIAEPVGARGRVPLNRIDALVMPLIAFDARGRRLGTGGGYYDRLLAAVRTRRRPWRVGYAYALQQVAALPDEAWDVPLHAVCTEHGLQRFTA